MVTKWYIEFLPKRFGEGKYLFRGEGKGGKYLEKEKKFEEKKNGKGKGIMYLVKENTIKQRRRQTEKEKEENIMLKQKLLRTAPHFFRSHRS